MSSFLAILFTVIFVGILMFVAIWALVSSTADLYKEAMIENLKKAQIGRSTKKHKTVSKRNHTY